MLARTRLSMRSWVMPWWLWAQKWNAQHIPWEWRSVFRQAFMWWAATRLMLIVVTYTALAFLSTPHPQNVPARAPVHVTLADLLTRWTLWDGFTYEQIARTNYQGSISAAFFPLYPLLIRSVMFVVGYSHAFAAALIVSNLATLAAFFTVGLLVADAQQLVSAAAGPLRTLAAYPLAFFLAATYTDGLFLALAAAALLCARRRAWYWAALWAFLTGLTRPTAVILVVPLLWEYWRNRAAWRAKSATVRASETALLASAVPLAWALFSAYSVLHFHDALAYVHAQARYGIHAQWPWQTIVLVFQQIQHASTTTFVQTRILTDAIPITVVLLVCALGWRTRPTAFSLYLAGLLVLTLSTPITHAIFPDAIAGGGRFMLAAIPAFLDLGRWSTRWPWLNTLLVSGGFAVQALLVAFVITGGWLI